MTDPNSFDESTPAPQDPLTAGFPEYGSTGDRADARRMRRSFRWCVFGCAMFVGILWFSERYLRYDLSESQYLAALTLEPESARSVLRQAVKHDTEEREFPTPKYLAALAEREQDDLVLPTYEKAYELDPNNPSLALRYGCRLFQAERYGEARDRFREAGVLPPKNALPKYLEAAALPWVDPAKEDLSESLALMARTNNGDAKPVFPKPLWAAGLPERGYWYERLRRQIADECCAPLYKYVDLVIRRARRQIELRQVQYWDSWLETLQGTGDRLMRSEPLGTLQATAGLRIQLAAIEQREAVAAVEGEAPPADLAETKSRIQESLARVNLFEAVRDDRIAMDRARRKAPLFLCWQSLGLASLFYLFAYSVAKAVGTKRRSWVLPHSTLGKLMLLGGPCVLMVVLAALTVAVEHPLLPQTPASSVPESGAIVFPGRVGGLVAAWWLVLGLLLLFGLAYPFLRLPSARTVLDTHRLGDSVEASALARKQRRYAIGAFLRRYYGVLFGILACLLSGWCVAYRVVFDLYPWQLEILTTGLGQTEHDLVSRILASLS